MDVTTPASDRWRTALLGLALVAAAVVAERRGSVDFPWIDLLAGCALLIAGLLAATRPGGRLPGVLLLAAGTTWFLSTADMDAGLDGMLIYIHRGFVVHAVLAAAATGRRLATLLVVATAYLASTNADRAFSTTWQLAVAVGAVTLLGMTARERRAAWPYCCVAGLGILAWTAAIVWLLPHELLTPALRSAVYGLGLAMAATAVAGREHLTRTPPPRFADIVRDRGTGDVWIGFRDRSDEPFLDLTGAPADGDLASALIVRSESGVETAIVHPGAAASTGRVRDSLLAAADLLCAYRDALADERERAREIAESERRIRAADAVAVAELARDLENSVMTPLTLAAGRLQGDHTDTAAETRAALESITAELRTVAAGIGPTDLDGGFGHAVAALAARSTVPVRTSIDAVTLDQASAAALYFVVAEAMTNAARHAGARMLEIDLVATQFGVDLTIADDGVGMVGSAEGGGLTGLRERLSTLGGTLTVAERAQGGTVVTAHLPLDDRVSQRG